MPKPNNLTHGVTDCWGLFLFKEKTIKVRYKSDNPAADYTTPPPPRFYLVGFDPQEKLLETKQGKETHLDSMKKKSRVSSLEETLKQERKITSVQAPN